LALSYAPDPANVNADPLIKNYQLGFCHCFMLRLIFKPFIVFLVVLTSSSIGQVINIENKRFLNDTNGWVGNTDFSFNVFNNTQQVLQFSNAIRVQYQKTEVVLF